MPASNPPKFLQWLGRWLLENQTFGFGGSTVAKLKIKDLVEGHHQEWSLRLNWTQYGKPHQAQVPEGLTD